MVAIEVLVLRGAMLSSVAVTLDLLATANRLRATEGRAPAFSMRLTGSGAAATRPLADALPAARDEPRLIVVPGLGLTREDEVRERLRGRDARQACRTLQRAIEGGIEVATSCSGAFLLASAGLLSNRKATTSWWLAPTFRKMHPDVDLDTDALLVRDGQVTTAGAAMAQMDLMLSIVSRHADVALADACARYLLMDERRSQAQYMALGFLAGADPVLKRAERWARDHLEQSFAIDELAAAAGLAPRTFARRLERATGLSPIRFVQNLRVERAMELIETTRLTLDEIAHRVGYAEPSTLRRILRRVSGHGARELRPVTRI